MFKFLSPKVLRSRVGVVEEDKINGSKQTKSTAMNACKLRQQSIDRRLGNVRDVIWFFSSNKENYFISGLCIG